MHPQAPDYWHCSFWEDVAGVECTAEASSTTRCGPSATSYFGSTIAEVHFSTATGGRGRSGGVGFGSLDGEGGVPSEGEADGRDGRRLAAEDAELGEG